MSNLQPIADQSVDMVYSGQSIEHVSPADAKLVFAEVIRVLKPGGFFCLDTPNGRMTRFQQDPFIDLDHKVEYTPSELSEALENAGFAIKSACGLNYAGSIHSRAEFNLEVLTRNVGLYADLDNCYLMGFVCQVRND